MHLPRSRKKWERLSSGRLTPHNIKDRLDFSCAVYAADGSLVAQAEHIPLHLGQLSWAIKNLLACLPADALEPDTIFMVNDTQVTGAHFPDILMVKPVFCGSSLVGIVANLAHHVDVGGFAPGSLYSGAQEAFQEGIRIPPVRIVRKGQVNEDILNFSAVQYAHRARKPRRLLRPDCRIERR